MSEKVLGITKGTRSAFLRTIYEDLFFTSDRVIVSRIGGSSGALAGGVLELAIGGAGSVYEKGYLELSPEELLKLNKRNFAIPNSEITKVELKKRRLGSEMRITTTKEKHKWTLTAIIGEKELIEKVKLEDYENILRPVFGDRLSVK